MLSLVGWLPIIGPIIDGIVSIFNKKQDTELGKYTVDGQVAQTQMQSANALAIAFMHDIPVRIARDMIMFPGSVWCGLVVWDKIVAIKYPWLVWGVLPLAKSGMDYLPYALLAFFFGAGAIMWTRK